MASTLTPTPKPVGPPDPWRLRPLWNRFTPLQLLVMAVATIAPMVIVTSIAAALLGVIPVEDMIEVSLGAGENPGMITFGAMFLATPMQWVTGRSQIRVRKYLGIVFFLLAMSNGAMFVVEEGIGSVFESALLVAGVLALTLASPLFLTSSRWSQRWLGMKKWRLLHKLTYVVAAALLAHVILIGDLGPGFVLILVGFIARIPRVRKLLESRTAS